MAKSKYAPALFEVIGGKDEKSPNKLTLPKWWRSKTPAAPSPEAKPDSGPETPAEAAAAVSTPPAPSPTPPVESRRPAPLPAPPHKPPQPGGSKPESGSTAGPSALKSSMTAVVAAVKSRFSGHGHAPPAAEGTMADEPGPRVFQVQEGRVELSLNPVHGAVIVGGLLILVLVAFQLGRGLRPDPQTAVTANSSSEFQELLGQGTKPNVLASDSSSAGSSGPRSAQANAGTPARPQTDHPSPPAGQGTPEGSATGGASATGSIERIPDHHYLVFEGFKLEDRAQAEQLRDWLKAKHDINTSIERSRERLELVGDIPFKSADDRQAGEYRKRITDLGAQYKTEFGAKAAYNMRDPYYRMAKARPSR